jgi:UPF0755 protein
VTRFDVTHPPGANIHDLDRTLSSLGLAAEGEFLAAATNKGLLARLGIPGGSAEGFLFPDTYRLVKGQGAEEVVELLYRRFRRALTPELEGEIAASGLSLLEVVTMASVIEKETGVEAERPLVSAVIRKRLAAGMPLQMDPTVIYGRKAFGREITKEDLRTPTPYNTYTRKGLPAGPVCSPGLPSIRAALRPAPEGYLYFVSRNDGTHAFSRTLAEHNRAVARYRDALARERAAAEGVQGGGADNGAKGARGERKG